MWQSLVVLATPLNLTIASLVIVSILYSVSALAYLWATRPGMALAFVGYVIANVGIIWDAIQISSKL